MLHVYSSIIRFRVTNVKELCAIYSDRGLRGSIVGLLLLGIQVYYVLITDDAKENKMEAKKAKKKIKLQDLKLKNDVKGGMLACGPGGNSPTHNSPKGHGPQPNRFAGP